MKPIIIDTDMGYDDIIAISLLLLSNKYQVKAVSVVNGVSNLLLGVNNFSRILSFAKISNIPLIKGKSQVLSDNWRAGFPEIDIKRANNLTLLSKLPIPKRNNLNIKIYNSLEKVISLINNSPEKITLVCLGPLTNIAYLITKYKNGLINKIDQIFLMGGAINVPGIVPPINVAEYNIYLDPEAADTVFKSKIPTTMVPIDATKKVPATSSIVKNKSLKKILGRFNQIIKNKRTLNKLSQVILEIILNNNRDFDSFYDPLVSAILINSQIVRKSVSGNVQVVKIGKNRGQTKLMQGKTSNTRIITQVNSNSFYQELLSFLY